MDQGLFLPKIDRRVFDTRDFDGMNRIAIDYAENLEASMIIEILRLLTRHIDR